MRNMPAKVICYLSLMALLTPSVAIARRDIIEGVGCDDNDYECIIETIQDSINEINVKKSAFQSAFQPWLDYNSKLRNVNWQYNQNSYAMFRTLYPRLAKLLEKELLDRYGVVPPETNLKVAALLGPIIGGISLSLALAVIWDNNHNQPRINAMVADLEAAGWPHEGAVVEANYQFMQNIGPMNQLIASIFPPAAGIIAIANAIRNLNILSSGKYYNIWAQFHHAQIRQMMEEQAAGRRTRDNGRSYIEWAARREGSLGAGGGVQAGCSAAIWIPGHYEYVPSDNGITVIWVEGRYQCIVQ
jgi:hypothetical protein